MNFLEPLSAGVQIVNTDSDAKTVGQGDGEDLPANRRREVLRAWHLRQRRTHHFVEASIPTHQ